MSRRRRSKTVWAMPVAVLALAGVGVSTAQARGWVGLGSGAPGWAYYAPTPYFAHPISADYHRFDSYHAYPDGFFIGGSFGGHYLHRWW